MKPNMKPNDVFTYTFTYREIARLYAILGKATGSFPSMFWEEIRDKLDPGQMLYDRYIREKDYKEVMHYHTYGDRWERAIFAPKETEEQKKIKELEETIKKAQEQIQELKEGK